MRPVHPLGPDQARALVLRAQGLAERAPFGLGKDAALRAVEHLGYVQIDTISVVERAHHHVLWSRVPDYRPGGLEEMLRERKIFEYWSHAAAYLPMRDFRFSLPRMRGFRKKFHWADDSPELRRALRLVIARIRRDGPLRARDFESKAPSRPGFWSFTKIEKQALHVLWTRGVLMVAGRDGFQKTYDLADHVLPSGIDRSPPSASEVADFLILRGLTAHGVAREGELSYLRGGVTAAAVRKRLGVLVRQGRVIPVRVGDAEKPAYVLAESLDQPGDGVDADARILSPFDNLVIQRERLRWLFGFDYQIECYVPAAKRRFGHFVLPVLWGDRFAARLEAKALRAESRLVVTGLWFEPGFEKDRKFRKALRGELERFVSFNGCRDLEDSPC